MIAHTTMLGFLRACNAADGFVYILTNESLPGLIKIGYTDRRPDDRATELNTTGVPTPFKIVFCFQHIDARGAEQAIHADMGIHRVRNDREFFRCDAVQAVTLILSRFSPSDVYDGGSYWEQSKVDGAAYTLQCKSCGGSGQIKAQQGFFQVQQNCPACDGRGKVKV